MALMVWSGAVGRLGYFGSIRSTLAMDRVLTEGWFENCPAAPAPERCANYLD